MPNLVVVAIPSEHDAVRKISSEKVPHMTLLFLGEMPVSNFADIANFVSYAAERSLTKFGMDVDRRGTLGEDEADVLFFNKARWTGYQDVAQFRAYLLQNANIRAAYEANQQFPEWLPHLTLGYPETPAKPDTRDYPGLSYVQFDRIALWFNDYDGFEYPLKSEFDELMEVAMGEDLSNPSVIGQEATEALLMHYGVKGMKWGVRRKNSPRNSSRVTVTTRKRLGTIKTQGGKGRKPSADATRAAIVNQISKKSGQQALSNKDLKLLIERLELEKRAGKLQSERSIGTAFVDALLNPQKKN